MASVKLELPNGLRIVTEELPHIHSISMGVFVKVGSRYETKKLSGVSHFLEHMFFKGTERRNAREISEAIEGIGGYINASTGSDTTIYHTKVADIHFDYAIDVLSDMLLNSRFEAKEVEKERGVIIEEINMSHDQPSDWVHQLLDESMWGDQPLGWDIAGTAETVSQITRDDLLDYERTHYTLGNTVISIAGNRSSTEMVDTCIKAFADYPAGALHKPTPTVPITPGSKVCLVQKDTEQANFCLGLPSLSFNDPDRRALQVLDSVLGGGMASRLFQEIREEQGLAYSVFSYNAEYDDAGKWVIGAGVELNKVKQAITACVRELQKLRDEGITAAELQRVKEQVKGSTLIGFESSMSVVQRNGAHILRYGEVHPVEQFVAEIEAVTQEDVLRVAQRLVQPDRLHLALIGPYQNEAEFRELLAV